ncbi:MAG: MFS transporter [Bacteroidetes bacterium]|nr:MFS transporter [Bacteroidota bacterium]
MQKQRSVTVLPFIVAAQFACTSVWFAGNAVINDIIRYFALSTEVLGHLVSAVQLGFITGTLLFAVFTVSDRFSPSRVFVVCALAAALCNLSVFVAEGFSSLMLARFATGFFLAGIYPVGMKIAADHHQQGLGTALGWLVGALVLGTAFPHLVHVYPAGFSWKWVIAISALLSVTGAWIIGLFVPDGPYRSRSNGFDPAVLLKIFRNADFRSAALGYFGHMWELYAFWAFVPSVFHTYFSVHNDQGNEPVALLSFLVIAIGAPACVMGGYLSRRWGSARTAFLALLISASCCLLSPFFFQLPFPVFLLLMLVWGMSVVADSPQFSTLVAGSISPEVRGTALTITNSIGFTITILSIETLNYLRDDLPSRYLYLLLAAGPLLGMLAMKRQLRKTT